MAGEITLELKGQLMPPEGHGSMKGAYTFMELAQPYQGRRYGVMSAETQGRQDVAQRLGRDFRRGDEITIRRFELRLQDLRVLEVA